MGWPLGPGSEVFAWASDLAKELRIGRTRLGLDDFRIKPMDSCSRDAAAERVRPRAPLARRGNTRPEVMDYS